MRTDAAAVVPLVPYHAWAERGPSTMRVWIAPIRASNSQNLSGSRECMKRI
ncbi:hypothetical protein [Agromyces aureus]|uniref:hypothetical protein n=1 Tax=Agromyces aureus TaxID=453304 RepID=UPI003B84532C